MSNRGVRRGIGRTTPPPRIVSPTGGMSLAGANLVAAGELPVHPAYYNMITTPQVTVTSTATNGTTTLTFSTSDAAKLSLGMQALGPGLSNVVGGWAIFYSSIIAINYGTGVVTVNAVVGTLLANTVYTFGNPSSSFVLPAGYYKVALIPGGGGGGGCAGGASSWFVTTQTAQGRFSTRNQLTTTGIDNSSGSVAPIVQGMQVTGSTITGSTPGTGNFVTVINPAGSWFSLLAVGTAAIGTYGAAAAYTFTNINNAAGGGSAGASALITIRSDGITPFTYIAGVGGGGGTGTTQGYQGNATWLLGGPDNVNVWGVEGGGGFGASATQMGAGAYPGTGATPPVFGPAAYWFPGGGGSPPGVAPIYFGIALTAAANEIDIGGAVGGGSGGPASSTLGGGAGHAGTVIGDGAGGSNATQANFQGANGLSATANVNGYGCGGGGAGANATASAVAAVGGAGGPGYMEIWRVG